MEPEDQSDPHAPLPAGELDHLAQTVYGVVVALNAHLRRYHRPPSQAAQDVIWAIEQLNDIQGRLTQASRFP